MIDSPTSPSPSTPLRFDKFLPIVLMLAMVVVAFGTIKPSVDVDTWWHLAVGKWVVEKQTVPWTDPFSQYGIETKKSWIAYSWLYEVALYGCYQWQAESGIVFFRVLLALSTIVICILATQRANPHSGMAFGISLLVFLGLVPTVIMERPWNFTVIGCWLTWFVIHQTLLGKKTKALWLLPIVYLLWANIHIQFIYGLAMLGIACLVSLVPWVMQKQPTRKSPFVKLFFLSLACFLATLITPYHIWLYWVVWDYATSPAAFELITELKPPRLTDSYQWFVLGITVATVVVFMRSRVTLMQRKSSTWFALLFFVLAIVMGMRAVRDLWFIILACVSLLSLLKVEADQKPTSNKLFHLLLPFITLFAAWTSSSIITTEKVLEEQRKRYPADAVKYVQKHQLHGPLLNSFDWGGYLIWNLPTLPVSLDGRTNLHGDQRLKLYHDAWFVPTEPLNLPDLKRCTVIIIEKQAPLAAFIRKDKTWTVAFEDEVAVVFRR